MTFQKNSQLPPEESPFPSRRIFKAAAGVFVMSCLFFGHSARAQMSTNLGALPQSGGESSYNPAEQQAYPPPSQQAYPSTSQQAYPPPSQVAAPPSGNGNHFSNNDYQNSYGNYGGASSSGGGVVSSGQAKEAADNLGISSGYSGASFEKPANNANSANNETNAPPQYPAQYPSQYPAQYPPQRETSSQEPPPLLGRAPSTPAPSASRNARQNASASPPYENGISHVNRTGTTVIPHIPHSPPPLILAPPFPAVTLHPPVQPEPVAAVKGAISDTRPLANSLEGIRIEFAALKDDMNQETVETISRFGKHMANNPRVRLLMEGFAGSQDDDPSLPRRLALQRLLKIRSLLMRAGVASTRIYPKTIGVPRRRIAHETNGPADRVDIYPEENPNELIPGDDAIARAHKSYPGNAKS